jgi:hypothetical protein
VRGSLPRLKPGLGSQGPSGRLLGSIQSVSFGADYPGSIQSRLLRGRLSRVDSAKAFGPTIRVDSVKALRGRLSRVDSAKALRDRLSGSILPRLFGVDYPGRFCQGTSWPTIPGRFCQDPSGPTIPGRFCQDPSGPTIRVDSVKTLRADYSGRFSQDPSWPTIPGRFSQDPSWPTIRVDSAKTFGPTIPGRFCQDPSGSIIWVDSAKALRGRVSGSILPRHFVADYPGLSVKGRSDRLAVAGYSTSGPGHEVETAHGNWATNSYVVKGLAK